MNIITPHQPSSAQTFQRCRELQGDRICDVCKHAITNLPEVSPRASSEGASDGQGGIFDEDERHPHGLHGPYMNDHIPGSADVIFDCIRVRTTESV